jgi:hypothetical protein
MLFATALMEILGIAAYFTGQMVLMWVIFAFLMIIEFALWWFDTSNGRQHSLVTLMLAVIVGALIAWIFKLPLFSTIAISVLFEELIISIGEFVFMGMSGNRFRGK